MESAGQPLQCSACRTIDRADGVEDGRLYPVVAARVKNEMRIFKALRDVQDRIADTITSFAGSMRFVYMHSVWFFVWIAFNLGFVSTFVAFDRYPFGLLTMIVSLEAIFLSTFVMISQNRQAERADIRSQVDFENNLRSEIWAVHIGQALGIDVDHVEGVVFDTIAGYRAEGSV
jgi:uncharacterized membrane protein